MALRPYTIKALSHLNIHLQYHTDHTPLLIIQELPPRNWLPVFDHQYVKINNWIFKDDQHRQSFLNYLRNQSSLARMK